VSSTEIHQECEHDQLVRLKERIKIYRSWLKCQHYSSDVDEYKVWEDLKNDTLTMVEKEFDKWFGGII
jgi:hypothetical protein